jgi:HAE1 family hydrophobic/amphiphilic exporter-1
MEEVKAKAMTPGHGDELYGIKDIGVSTIVFCITPFNPVAPRLYLDIDRDKAQKMGLSLTEVFATLQTNIGSAYVNDFNMFNRTFRVNVQAMGHYRANSDAVLNMKVKNNAGAMVPLSSFVTIKEVTGPQLLTRYNLFPSASMMGIVRGDKSTGEAMAKMDAIDLPDGFSHDWTGLSYQEKRVGSQTLMIFILAIIFGFLILVAQYESWTAPMIIMMAVPIGVTGSLIAVLVYGFTFSKMEINLYTQIGLVLMIGLSAKNAILITEFAREKRRHGATLVEAAYQAGRLRLRPIMMTSFAFILGVLPLIILGGAGANSRGTIGSCVFGGLLMETMVGVYVTPVLFVLLQKMAESSKKHINAQLDYSRRKAER